MINLVYNSAFKREHFYEPVSSELPQLLAQFLPFLHTALQQQGSWEVVSKAVETMMQQGTGAARQHKVHQQTGSLQQVVDFIVKKTATGTSSEYEAAKQ